ncbi:MAG TPA: NUDIX domain-containing protein [Gaiellaceae bacterium]|nr:NUDIX domain-containing protein [Gaiellaceae bacterium]
MAEPDLTPSDVPDVLAPGLRIVFVGINPGRVSAAARAHFANPRNDFWRLLDAAGLTSRLYEPHEQFALLEEGIGVTNAAYRTTPGSGDLRRGDFAGSAERLFLLARDLRPRAFAFVGKEAYRGVFGVRPELGVQPRILVDTGLFVLPSTSPANAAVPYAERLRWFRALHDWVHVEPTERRAVRALTLDSRGRTLLVRWPRPGGSAFWIAPGGGVEPGESDEEALHRELAEELGLVGRDLGPCIWTREFSFPWNDNWWHQTERYHVVHVEPEELGEGEEIENVRWWTVAELEATDELIAPARLGELLRDLAANGPPRDPVDVGI